MGLQNIVTCKRRSVQNITQSHTDMLRMRQHCADSLFTADKNEIFWLILHQLQNFADTISKNLDATISHSFHTEIYSADRHLRNID